MTVTSIRDAWAEVNKIFQTDYEHDADHSERAGYPIYYSTAASVNAWISDLGNRLEVNLPDGLERHGYERGKADHLHARGNGPQLFKTGMSLRTLFF